MLEMAVALRRKLDPDELVQRRVADFLIELCCIKSERERLAQREHVALVGLAREMERAGAIKVAA